MKKQTAKPKAQGNWETERQQYENEQKRNLPNQRMPFGKHKDVPLKDVPLEYMAWVSKQDVGNYSDLTEYIGDLMREGKIPWEE